MDAQTNFDLAGFGGQGFARAFTVERVWHMGIVLAAQELNLDLAHAEIDLPRGKIILRGPPGVERIIPVDEEGYFYINWELTSMDPRLTIDPFEKLLAQDNIRTGRATGGVTNHWANKLAVIGSRATGNDLSDRGATPLEKDTFLVTKHWNVANAVIMGRFVHQASLATELGLIVILGLLTALMTWQWRVLPATFGVLALMVIYCGVGTFVYVQNRYWLPLVLPGVTVVLIQYISLVAYRVIVEQTEKRRVKSVFSKIVSPNIVHELLEAEKLSLGGARREVTVLFADVRGFTKFTDESQQQAEAHVAANRLSGAAREAYFDEQAREALQTVNTYLSLVADKIKAHAGTLDKYIGDCVMAFWGAPTPNPRHATDCVRAAIDTQRTIYELNRQRAEHNRKLASENSARASAGLPQKMPLPILLLGSGINTGLATVGLMGSEAHISNYTVFGREVNLASRLEGVSGSGRIIISDTTYYQLLRHAPELASTCSELMPVKPKGFTNPVRIYEVPWQNK
jgi:adenylate cyclase